MKRNEEMMITSNHSVYKKIRLSIVLSCPICRPNRGCNRKYKERLRSMSNWKTLRLCQYK